jgi:hypothetical protein
MEKKFIVEEIKRILKTYNPIFLKSLLTDNKYIAVNKNGNVYAYSYLPRPIDHSWSCMEFHFLLACFTSPIDNWKECLFETKDFDDVKNESMKRRDDMGFHQQGKYNRVKSMIPKLDYEADKKQERETALQNAHKLIDQPPSFYRFPF